MWCHSWKWNKVSHIGEFESKQVLEIPLGNFLGMPCEVKCKISTSLPPALQFSENYLESDSLPTKHLFLSHTHAHTPPPHPPTATLVCAYSSPAVSWRFLGAWRECSWNMTFPDSPSIWNTRAAYGGQHSNCLWTCQTFFALCITWLR